MKIMLLGGYGQFGLPAAKHLARFDLIDEIIIAGRSLEKAQEAVVTVGPKDRGLQLDADWWKCTCTFCLKAKQSRCRSQLFALLD